MENNFVKASTNKNGVEHIDNYMPIPYLPKDRPLTDDEKANFELYEKDLSRRLKEEVIKVNGEYALRINGNLYKLKSDL